MITTFYLVVNGGNQESGEHVFAKLINCPAKHIDINHYISSYDLKVKETNSE